MTQEQESNMAVATDEKQAGWIFVPEVEHRCIVPTERALRHVIVGSIWKCGTCGNEWEVHFEAGHKAMKEAT